MEERQSEKRRDRERRWQEEMHEEARLQKERDNLQKQYENEEQKKTSKKVAHVSRFARHCVNSMTSIVLCVNRKRKRGS